MLMPEDRPARLVRTLPRVVIILAVATALLGGLASGLARLGWEIGATAQGLMLMHGPLMIGGFLGTLICLERAVALSSRTPWAFVVPLVNAVGALLLLVVRDAVAAQTLITLGSLGLALISALLLRQHYARYMVVMTLGSYAWLLGNLLWMADYPLYKVVHLWTAFLVLTIVGERMELSRVRMLPPQLERLLMTAVAIYLAGVLIVLAQVDWGIRILGVGALLMAVWLLRFDIARVTIRSEGLARYIAACLLSGYFWLAFGGIVGMWKGALYGGPVYAILLHAFLFGFVFSMIFGHAPIILPAVTGVRLDYHPIFYVHLVLLHVTLIFRTIANFTTNAAAQQWGGMLNVITVLIFLGVTIGAVVVSNQRAPSRQRQITHSGA